MKNLLKKLNELAKTVDLDQFYAIRITKWDRITFQGDINIEMIENLKSDQNYCMTEDDDFIIFKSKSVTFNFENPKL